MIRRTAKGRFIFTMRIAVAFFTVLKLKIVIRAQLFEGRLALNPGLNLTQVSFSCVQKHFLR